MLGTHDFLHFCIIVRWLMLGIHGCLSLQHYCQMVGMHNIHLSCLLDIPLFIQTWLILQHHWVEFSATDVIGIRTWNYLTLFYRFVLQHDDWNAIQDAKALQFLEVWNQSCVMAFWLLTFTTGNYI
jgi:hypothetical protein